MTPCLDSTARFLSPGHTGRALPRLALLLFATTAMTSGAACSTPSYAATAPAADSHRRTLTVTGTATVDLVPDCLDVSMMLSTDGDHPRQAMSALRAQQDVLVKALIAAGVAPGDVKLSGLNLQRKYDVAGRVKGYTASIGVVASTKKLELVGDLMEAASSAGTQSMSTSYRVSDLPSFKKKARRMALEAAADKAHETASALGTRLGHVADVNESASDWYPGATANSYTANAPGTTQLSPELQPLTLSINVVYELD
jgi:uncharacterized protein YggE